MSFVESHLTGNYRLVPRKKLFQTLMVLQVETRGYYEDDYGTGPSRGPMLIHWRDATQDDVTLMYTQGIFKHGFLR